VKARSALVVAALLAVVIVTILTFIHRVEQGRPSIAGVIVGTQYSYDGWKHHRMPIVAVISLPDGKRLECRSWPARDLKLAPRGSVDADLSGSTAHKVPKDAKILCSPAAPATPDGEGWSK
jgi:hypothetical protein